MRVILALLWALALFGFWTAPEGWSASPRQRKAEISWPRRVEGLGLDVDAAKRNALKTARTEVIACLRHSQPPIRSWTPGEEDIQTLVSLGEEGKDLPLDAGAAKRWILYLKQPDWNTFYQHEAEAQAIERRQRSGERLLLASKVLGGFMVALVAVILYVRLNDWTGGYYSRRLQAVGIGLVAAAVAGLWMLA